MTRRFSHAVLSITVSFAAAGCHRDPAAAAAQAIARGDQYVSARQFDEAIIEYRRAIQFTPARADAHVKLANAYAARGESGLAYAEYSRATDLDPTLADAQIAAGNLLLEAGQFDEAKARAEEVIAADPRDARAHILMGNALAGLHDGSQAVRQMEQAVALDPSSPDGYSALGSIQFAVANPSAGASFEKAVSLQPRSVDARIGLANYHWSAGDHATAEQDLASALEIDPSSAAAHRGLALMYALDKRPDAAEPHFKALAAQSPEGRLALADFYAGTDRLNDALGVLSPLAADEKLGRVARMRTAGILQRQGRRDEALATADALIKAQPSDADAHSLKARLLLTPPANTDAAWNEAIAAVGDNPDSAAAQFTRGLAARAKGDQATAEAAFKRTLSLDPRAEAAQVQLASVLLSRGDAPGAESAADAALALRPDDLDAAIVLAKSLRAEGELNRARREVMSSLARHANAGALWIELGEIELAAHRLPEAREAAAHARSAESDDNEDVQVLAARVAAASGNAADAEQGLLGVIQHHPERLDAYETLAAYYAGHDRAADALARYRALAARVPDQPGPATMVGILLAAGNDRAGARAQYEAVLARHPRAPVAANNLAWMLAEEGKYDDAVRWASVAADGLRGRPEPQDTLGWIYLKTDRPADALAAFERASSAAPQEPLYAQHVAQAKKALKGR
jgi:tetratricopeptide (TPR) repeat protein